MENNPIQPDQFETEYMGREEKQPDLELVESDARRLMDKISDGERLTDPEMVKMCRMVITQVALWAAREGITLIGAERLGGTCQNPVLMIMTADGRSLVAKGFKHDFGADNLRYAQFIIDQYSLADAMNVPSAVKWITEGVYLAEKKNGGSVKNALFESLESEGGIEKSKMLVSNIGRKLAVIHSHYVEKIEPNLDPTLKYQRDSKEALATKDLALVVSNLDLLNKWHLVDFEGMGSSLDTTIAQLKEKLSIDQCCLVHGDPHFGNFFVDKYDSILSVVDYDTINLGNPSADIGRARASLILSLKYRNYPDEIIDQLLDSLDSGYQAELAENTPEVIARKAEIARIPAEQLASLKYDREKSRLFELRFYFANIVHITQRSTREKIVNKKEEIAERFGVSISGLNDGLRAVGGGKLSKQMLREVGFAEIEIENLFNMSNSQKEIEKKLAELSQAI
jgi:hypothetical protein